LTLPTAATAAKLRDNPVIVDGGGTGLEGGGTGAEGPSIADVVVVVLVLVLVAVDAVEVVPITGGACIET
jgi:hypothetical protein